MAKRKISLLLVDDHAVVREGIRLWLSSRKNMEIAGEASSGEEAVKMAKELLPDIILVDISLPDMNGMELAKILQQELPKCKLIALTMHHSSEYVIEMMRYGARGYVLKDVSPGELVRAVETVYQGETFFSNNLSKNLANELIKVNSADAKPLSKREKDILKLIAQGYTSREISEMLSLSIRTVETHRENLRRKINVRSVAGLTQYAISNGLISVERK